jgi:uncharacterized membrane protein
MNSVQMHLALTHVPVILSMVGLTMLVVAFFIKNPTVTKISYYVLVVAGISAIPVFFTGEGAEEAVEHLPGVSESFIEEHEEVAKLSMIAISVAGVAALAALLSFSRHSVFKVVKVVVLILALVSGGLMAQTAHLGGQIRHTEIQGGIAFQNSNEAGGENADAQEKQEDEDDD